MNKIYQRDTESTAEFILPDYMGDVKKILTVSARAIPSGKFVNDGEAEFSGIVNYEVTYSDADGELTAFNFSSDYDISLKIEDDTYEEVFGDFRVSSFSLRPTGPRKLVGKSIVTGAICVSLEDSLSCEGDAFEDESEPEIAQSIVKCEKILYSSSPEREFAEEAELLSGIDPEDVEIITTAGTVRITESTPTTEGVLVRGEIIVTAIVKTDEQPPFAIRRSVPFEEIISLDGVSEDMATVADGILTSVSSAVRADDGGSMITVSAIAEFSCVAATNTELSVMTDAYLKERDVESIYEDFVYSELASLCVSEEKFSVKTAREELGIAEARDVIMMSAEVRSLEKELNGTHLVISGEAVFSGIACEIKEDNGVSYLPVKFSAPFTLKCALPQRVELSENIEVRPSVVDVGCVLDADDLTAEVTLKIFQLKSSTQHRLTDIAGTPASAVPPPSPPRRSPPPPRHSRVLKRCLTPTRVSIRSRPISRPTKARPFPCISPWPMQRIS